MATAGETGSTVGAVASQEAAYLSARNNLLRVWALTVALLVVPALALSLIPQLPVLVSASVSAFFALVLVIVFSLFAPSDWLVTALAPRVTACLYGVVSVLTAWLLGLLLPGTNRAGASRAVLLWLLVTVVALVLLVLGGFAFEMGRKDRLRLIESFSTLLATGIMAWAAGGWVFVTSLFRLSDRFPWYLSALLLILLSILLSWGFARRSNDEDETWGETEGTESSAAAPSVARASRPDSVTDTSPAAGKGINSLGLALGAAADSAQLAPVSGALTGPAVSTAATAAGDSRRPHLSSIGAAAPVAIFSFGSLPVMLTGLLVPVLVVAVTVL